MLRMLGIDRGLLGKSGCASRASHVGLCIKSPHGLDLPLRRSGPYRVCPPDHVVGAEALDQRAHQSAGPPCVSSDQRPSSMEMVLAWSPSSKAAFENSGGPNVPRASLENP